MRSALLFLACLGVSRAQLGPSDQSFIDAALGAGGGGNSGGGNSGGGNSGIGGGATEYRPCDGGTKSCVPYFLCEEGNIVTDGAGVIDIRFGGASNEAEHVQHSDCGDQYTSVCCTDPQREHVKPEPLKQSYKPQCGRRNALGINARIVGIKDNEAQFGEYPWMAAVLKEDAGKLVFLCGASLIRPNVLVTAAHCVYDIENLVVRLGEWDTQHTTEFYKHLDADVAKVVVHKGYNHPRKNLHNDIALLFLNSNVCLKEHIDTICLPTSGDIVSDGDCYATGWGKDNFAEKGEYQLVLKQVPLPLVDRATCEAQLKHTRLGQRFRLDESFICAGGKGPDTCTGDGGSPLVCPDPTIPGRYTQRGIVSWGIGCGQSQPGVYVDVTHFRHWIEAEILNYPTPTGPCLEAP